MRQSQLEANRYKSMQEKATKHEEDVDDDKKAMFRLHIVRSADE